MPTALNKTFLDNVIGVWECFLFSWLTELPMLGNDLCAVTGRRPGLQLLAWEASETMHELAGPWKHAQNVLKSLLPDSFWLNVRQSTQALRINTEK